MRKNWIYYIKFVNFIKVFRYKSKKSLLFIFPNFKKDFTIKHVNINKIYKSNFLYQNSIWSNILNWINNIFNITSFSNCTRSASTLKHTYIFFIIYFYWCSISRTMISFLTKIDPQTDCLLSKLAFVIFVTLSLFSYRNNFPLLIF